MKWQKLQRTLLVFTLIAVTLTYINHFHNSFHFDDAHTIQNNPYTLDLGNTLRFFTDATTFSSQPANQMYRPLVTLSFALDARLSESQLKPFWFHVSQFFWYLVLLVLLYFFFLHIFNRSVPRSWNGFLALFAVAWFGLHTANAETINYICARSDSFSTLFVVLGFILYFYSETARRYHLYLIPVLLGGLTKPTALMFAPLLLVYLLLFNVSFTLSGLRHTTGWKPVLVAIRRAAPAFLLSLLVYLLQERMTPPTFFPSAIPTLQYAITQPFVIFHYFITFFMPVALSADTDWGPLASWLDLRFFSGMVFVLFMLALAVYTAKWRRSRPISFGILWFFIALLPTSSFISLSEVLNDHRMFFPFIGLMVAVVWSIGQGLARFEDHISLKTGAKFIIIFLAVSLLSAHAYGTWKRNQVWRSEESLWYDVTVKSPKNGRGLMNYGLTHMVKGDFTGALEFFTRAKTYTPDYPLLEINLGIVKNAMNRSDEAEKHFLRALQLAPQAYSSYHYYANFLVAQGQPEMAVPLYKNAIALNPGFMDTRYSLMQIYAQQKAWDFLRDLATETLALNRNDATVKQYLQNALQQRPDPQQEAPVPDHTPQAMTCLQKSVEFYNEKKFHEAIEVLQQAIALKPDLAEAYNNLGASYCELQRWNEAIEVLQQAIALKPDFQLARNNLAWAQHELQKARP